MQTTNTNVSIHHPSANNIFNVFFVTSACCAPELLNKNLNLMYSFELSINQNDRCKGQWKRIRRKYNIWADETQNYTNFLPPSFNLPFYSSFIVLLEHLWNYRDKALNNETKYLSEIGILAIVIVFVCN